MLATTHLCVHGQLDLLASFARGPNFKLALDCTGTFLAGPFDL